MATGLNSSYWRMRYQQSKEESNELLRLALPHIARHGSGCHPPSYALWYEYVEGGNPRLRGAIDARIAQQDPLSADETRALYREFIADREIAATDELQAQLLQSLDGLGRAAAAVGGDAAKYGESLSNGGKQLESSLDLDAVRRVVAALAAETRRMQASNAMLTEELEANRRELVEISARLAAVRGEALLDPLTGLTNRRGFQRAIDSAITNTNGVSGLDGWTLLMVDIDHFKSVNDMHGHVLGDKVLQSVAAVIRGSIKSHHVATRFGGEEFAILLPECAEGEALALAEQIRVNVARGRIRRGVLGQPVGGITVSLGVATYRSGESLEQWISRADRALYESKETGRNRVTVAPSA